MPEELPAFWIPSLVRSDRIQPEGLSFELVWIEPNRLSFDPTGKGLESRSNQDSTKSSSHTNQSDKIETKNHYQNCKQRKPCHEVSFCSWYWPLKQVAAAGSTTKTWASPLLAAQCSLMPKGLQLSLVEPRMDTTASQLQKHYLYGQTVPF